MTFLKRIFTEYRALLALIIALVIGLVLQFSGYLLYANIIYYIAAIIAALPICVTIIKDVKRGNYGVDILAIIAIAASLALGEGLAAIVIALMLTGGEALEDYAQNRAQEELNDLLKRAPKIAHKKIGKYFEDVAVELIMPGDIILIKPGEVIPVDGIVTKGATSIDESALTGESLPLDKKINHQIMSGSINQQSVIEARALKSSHDSQYEQIIIMVQDAASSRSPLVRLADKYSVPFTIISLSLAALAWILSGNPVRALEVLVVATPCPLLIAAPVALVSGMSRAASQGIIVKGGGALETMARLQAIVFDKTGTLTYGSPSVKDIVPIDGVTKEGLLGLAASVESQSVHTLAQAVISYAKKQHIQLQKVSAVHELIGSGLSATISSNKILVGKYVYLHQQKIELPSAIEQEEIAGETAIFIAKNNKYIGMITFSDSVRDDAKTTISWLKKAHIKYMMMLTGDKTAVAKRIADRLNISEYAAECLPGDKLNRLKAYKKVHSPLAFVGDGVNDAPSLVAADVGIALGAKGNTAASESADVVIMLDDFSKVASSVYIGFQTIKIAKQSIFVGIGLSIGLMIFAGMTGVIKPVYGALLQEVVDVVVILNALRAHRGKLPF